MRRQRAVSLAEGISGEHDVRRVYLRRWWAEVGVRLCLGVSCCLVAPLCPPASSGLLCVVWVHLVSGDYTQARSRCCACVRRIKGVCRAAAWHQVLRGARWQLWP